MTTDTASREALALADELERLLNLAHPSVGMIDLDGCEELGEFYGGKSKYIIAALRAAHLAQQPVAAVDDRNYAMNSEPERKRFEEYIRERQPGASFVFHRRPNGPYIDDFTEYQWLAWDYRASLKPQPDPSRDEKLALIKYAIQFSRNRDYYSFEDILAGFES